MKKYKIDNAIKNFQETIKSVHEKWKANGEREKNFDVFLQILHSAIDKSCRLKVPKTTKRNQINNPWFTEGLRVSIEKRHKLYKEWKKSASKKKPDGVYELRQKFEAYRSHLQKTIKVAKQNFHLGQFENCNGDIKKTWKLINEIRGNKRSILKENFIIDNQLIQNRREIANKFNNYFASIAMHLNEAAENDFGMLIKTLPTFETYLIKPCENTIFIDECNEEEIVKIASEFANGKASDIHIRVIKRAVPVLAKYLKLLYNDCITRGNFPSALKVGRISPIFKKGDTQLIENYRPVSILPIFGKIFEKIIYARINSFVQAQGILHENQFGFQQGHSISHALNYTVTQISKNVKCGESVIGIFIDLSKAFDTIDLGCPTRLHHWAKIFGSILKRAAQQLVK